MTNPRRVRRSEVRRTLPDMPQSIARGRRLPLLLLVLVSLASVALFLYGESLQRWRYQRLPTDALLVGARTHPDDLLLSEAAGERLLNAGRPLEARDLLIPLAERAPQRVSLVILAGRAAWQAGDPEAAGRLLHRAVEQAPTNPEARYWTAEFLYSRGYAGEARTLLQEVVQLSPGHGQAWCRLGEIELNDEHYERALEQLDRAEKLQPSAESAGHRAAAFRALGRVPEARVAARAAYQRGRTADNAVLLGQILQLTPNAPSLQEAQELFREAVRLNPQSVEGYKLLAINQRSQGQYQEAVRTLRRMLRVAPAVSEGYLLLGQSYQALGNKPLADAVLRIYRAMEPRETRVSRAEYQANISKGAVLAQLALVRTYLEVGRQDLAREVLGRVRRKNPEHPEVAELLRQADGPPTLKIPPLPADPEGDAP